MTTEGNLVAGLVILAWPLVALYLFASKPVSKAVLWTILGALLLLPNGVAIKLDMIPALDKNSVPNVCVFVGCWALASHRDSFRGFRLTELLAAVLIFSPFLTSIYNSDTVVIGPTVLPGVGVYDAISAILAQVLFFLSFFVGRRFLSDAKDTENCLRALVIVSLIYSLPMLFEVRMSPQLAEWIYGFRASSFVTEMRYGGYRPVVFMKNGIATAFFTATAFLASIAFLRARVKILRVSELAVTSYLGLIVILCKSAGALAYSIILGFLIRLISPKAQVRLAVVLAAIVILYPLLRTFDFFPTRMLVDTAAEFSETRADSLRFRFDQEEALLEHASQRILLGWGRYGRNRVYSEETGADVSVTDSLWIQTIGQFGLVGFVAQFGLLTLPVFWLAFAYKQVPPSNERIFLAALALIVALTAVEQLINNSINSWTLLLSGSLLGRAQDITAKRPRIVAADMRPVLRTPS